ncbi:MAG: polyribonucleotide nucleotidyltransferase [Candidatus Dojkabacteria bacterium]|nr:polyribonucleotide nucleotidyltransferase [Candidatus Dojkabacteria bacterium]
MKEFAKYYDLFGKKLKISYGKFANLATSSVVTQVEGTTLLTTLVVDKKESVQSFLPLSVEYVEKMYASGFISTSPFKKREGIPSDDAIIKARIIDHSIRSLFPKNFKKGISIVVTVLSYDQVNDPEPLALLGTSLCLMLADLPFFGPASGVVACLDKENNILFNPPADAREEFNLELFISGVDKKILNIEGWGKEIDENTIFDILESSILQIQYLNNIQLDFYKLVHSKDFEHSNGSSLDLPVRMEIVEYIQKNYASSIENILFMEEKVDLSLLTQRIVDEILSKIIKTQNCSNVNISNPVIHEGVTINNTENNDIITNSHGQDVFNLPNDIVDEEIKYAIDYVARNILRKNILNQKRRLNRGLYEIRPIRAEIDVIPYVHGSALFTRGLTQSLSIVTLGSSSDRLMVEGMEGEEVKRFIHHYNMPNYATGEYGKYSYHPGRREIGHGNIGENALKNLLPPEKDFPYTIRVVSEILTSNGSTSMAATCASSLALMAAGVPLKTNVAGISIGLVIDEENEQNYKLLMDIEGIEDFYGDMDFKVAGTANGVTSIQYENKVRGVSINIIKEAFMLAKQGREQILQVMNQVISEPRKCLSPNAPIIDSVKISSSDIGSLIGPGGKNIKDLILRSTDYAKNKVNIVVEEDGNVVITAFNKPQLDYVKNYLQTFFVGAEIGKVYEGVITNITDYGFFVEVSSKIYGLCHISEIVDRRISPIELKRMFKVGQRVKVKAIKIDSEGRVNFSMKGIHD